MIDGYWTDPWLIAYAAVFAFGIPLSDYLYSRWPLRKARFRQLILNKRLWIATLSLALAISSPSGFVDRCWELHCQQVRLGNPNDWIYGDALVYTARWRIASTFAFFAPFIYLAVIDLLKWGHRQSCRLTAERAASHS